MSNGEMKRGHETGLKRDGRKSGIKRAKYASYEFLANAIRKQLLTKDSYVGILSRTPKVSQKVT